MRSDRQTETTKLIDAFDNISNVPNSYSVFMHGLFPCFFNRMVGMEGNRVQNFCLFNLILLTWKIG